MYGNSRMMLLMLLVLLSPLVFLSGTALADKVVLENGDALTGTVVKLEGGKLTLKTDYAGPVEIEAAKVKSIVTDQPVEVHTTTGEVLKGKLKMVEPGKLAVEPSPDRAATDVDLQKVAAINPPPQGVWTGSITVGGNLQSGNTDRTGLSVGAGAERRTAKDRFTLGFLFNYTEEEDEITARNTYGLAKYDYFFTKKLYGYLALELLNDQFQDIKLRTIVGPGMGYQIWDDPVKSLLVEGGVAYAHEDLYEGENQDYLAARLAADFRYNIHKFIVFGDHGEIYPSLKYGGEYTLRNEAYLMSPLGAGWALKFSNIIERNSDPSPGVYKDDIYWILALQYSF